MKSTVTQIERGAAYDGPGLRTVVFFKGCPLKCFWCANPETQNPRSEMYFDQRLCVNCGECHRVCPRGNHTPGRRILDCGQLPECGACVANCPSAALRQVGKEMDASEIFAEVQKDRAFYEASGGGVTLSGGEVLANAAIALEVLRLCKQDGIHTAVETSGYGNREELKEIAGYTDLFLFDIKHPDSACHEQATGVSNEIIVENLRMLVAEGVKVIIRLPLIPGVNDGDEAVNQLLALMAELHLTELHILPYHSLASDKYRKLGREYVKPVMEKEMTPENIAAAAQAAGIKAKIGGIN